jgi:hypothetical protein
VTQQELLGVFNRIIERNEGLPLTNLDRHSKVCAT